MGPQARYFSRLNDGIFELQQCNACLKHQFFPRSLCHHCGSIDLRWTTPSGHGELYSFSIIRRKPEHGGDYNVALINLEEGVRLMSRIDDTELNALRIGQKVKAAVIKENNQGLLVFRLTEAQ